MCIYIYVELMQGFNSASPSSSLSCRAWVTWRRDHSGYGSNFLRPREPQVLVDKFIYRLQSMLWDAHFDLCQIYFEAPWWGGSKWIIELCQWWFLMWHPGVRKIPICSFALLLGMCLEPLLAGGDSLYRSNVFTSRWHGLHVGQFWIWKPISVRNTPMTQWRLGAVPQATVCAWSVSSPCWLTELMRDGFKDMFVTCLVPGWLGQCKYECAKNCHVIEVHLFVSSTFHHSHTCITYKP